LEKPNGVPCHTTRWSSPSRRRQHASRALSPVNCIAPAKNIRLGPSLPAFVTPAVLNVLIEKFNIMPITTVENDLNACLKTA
jgi:hypothetical protein